MMKKLFLITLFALQGLISYGQINTVAISSTAHKQFKRMDFNVNLKATWDNPFLQEQVSLDLLIETPSGVQLKQPSFYVSGQSGKESIWQARFAPREVGTYKFQFVLQQGNKKPWKSEWISHQVQPSKDKGFLKVKNDWILQFDNGNPFRGIGENICWESRDHDDSKFFSHLHERHDHYNYDVLLPDFAKNGGNFFRTWICSWNLPIDYGADFNNSRYTESTTYYNESAVARLDHLVDLADSLDLYIMLTLGTGNYRDRDPGVVNTADDFFANTAAKVTYKNRLRYIVARWAYSPHIAMWEFLNEVDNIQFNGRESNPINPQDIVAWHTEMATYLKSIDPYQHIVTTSISHRDIAGLNEIADIDINQKHIYNNTEVLPQTIIDYTAKHGKPYIIGEYGHEWDWQKNFDDFSYEMEVDFKRGLWYGIFSPTPVTPMSWWWEYFENRGLRPYYNGLRTINKAMLESGNGEYVPLKSSAGDLQTLAVKCGEHIYAYVYNPTSFVSNATLRIDVEDMGNMEVSSFQPSTQRFLTSSGQALQDGKQIIIPQVYIGSKNELIYIIK